jgi:hypothetical protein
VGQITSFEASHWNLLKIPFHNTLPKVELGLGRLPFLNPNDFNKSLLILNRNVNKSYRLPLERLYGRRIFENHDFRK